ncbi:hypothetical protein FB451DRAFT_1277011 [Mycena latifolia]|nr:hypothetical protein FB451DRAFT_1277011 [Mycena latifolia]
MSISTGNIKKQCDLLATIAWITSKTGDYSGAKVHAYESQRLAKICGDLFREAWALRIQSMCLCFLVCYSHSLSLSARAIGLLELCGMGGSSLHYALLTSKVEVHRFKSEYMEARNHMTHMLHTLSLEQQPYRHAVALLNFTQIDVEISTSTQTVQWHIDTAISLCNTMPLVRAWCEMFQAALCMREGDLMRAKRLFYSCFTFAWGKDNETVSYCLERLGNFCHWGVVDQTSYVWTVIFFVYSLKLKQKLETHKALQFLGDMYLAQGDHHTAISLFTVALDGFTQMDIHRSRAECILQLGDISKLDGDMVKAVELWQTARPLFERSSQNKQIAEIDERLAGKGSSFLPVL